MIRARAGLAAAVVVAPLLLAGCTTVDCFGLEATATPEAVAPGATVTVDVLGAIATCGDWKGDVIFKDEVAVSLVPEGGGFTLVTATVPATNGEASAHLTLPGDAAAGTYGVWVDDQHLDDIEIVAP